MISDADGKQYPWYGSKTEVQTLEGPTMQPTHVTIHMNDNFFPQVRRIVLLCAEERMRNTHRRRQRYQLDSCVASAVRVRNSQLVGDSLNESEQI